MAKVLFEVEVSSAYDIEVVCDFITELMAKDMKDFVSFSSIGLSKEVITYHIEMFSLSEFLDELDAIQRKRLICKMLLDRLFPVIYEKKIMFLAELDCFRPGYIVVSEAEEFTNTLYVIIAELLTQIQNFIKKHITKLDPVVRNEVRSLYRITEFTRLGLRDLTYKEQVEIADESLLY